MPIIPLTYWSFRIMIGLGVLGALAGIWLLWATRKPDKLPTSRLLWWMAVTLPFMPLFANSFGWIFTEMGRQPWAVFGLMTVDTAVSPEVSATEMMISLVTLTLLYGALAVVEVKLMLTYIKRGADPVPDDQPPSSPDSDADRPLAFAY